LNHARRKGTVFIIAKKHETRKDFIPRFSAESTDKNDSLLGVLLLLYHILLKKERFFRKFDK